jgi:hypothetical protein
MGKSVIACLTAVPVSRFYPGTPGGVDEGGPTSIPIPQGDTTMSHAIIRGKSGRRHEVDFGDEAVRVEIHSSEETVEIFVEADFGTLPEERRRFAILNIPRHLFSEATAVAARRAAKSTGERFGRPG